MKKKLMSVLLAAAMVASMAVGCGSDKKASSDSGDTKKTESTEKKTESNQILFNGSSTLAPVITSIATDFFDTYGTWDAYDSSLPKEDIAIYVSAGGSGQGTKAVIDGTSTFGMVARSVKDEEKEAIKDEKEYQVGIDALTIAVNPENPVTGVLDDLSTEQIVSLFSGKYATWKDLDPSLTVVPTKYSRRTSWVIQRYPAKQFRHLLWENWYRISLITNMQSDMHHLVLQIRTPVK